ncbi:MAG: autotransporter-associated beta strand repeat-containing protein, partial [Brevundimonas sp.]|uniref:autotransporter-associated beta strand repeat-containing protein n=1 Tax=Brevundimonas sp. TaxID=1871086 RepID=UPI004033D2ED
MTSKISRRASGATVRVSDEAMERGRRRVRAGLLASTALVAASLAATGASAQSISPTGGGTITYPNGTVTNNTPTGGGIQILNLNTNAPGASRPNIVGVNYTNTTGAAGGLTANGLTLHSSAASAAPSPNFGDPLGDPIAANQPVFYIGTTVAGGAALDLSTRANLGVQFYANGTLAGPNGVKAVTNASGGFINFVLNNGAYLQVIGNSSPGGIGIDLDPEAWANIDTRNGRLVVSGFEHGIRLNSGQPSTIWLSAASSVAGSGTGILVETAAGQPLTVENAGQITGGSSGGLHGGGVSLTNTGTILGNWGVWTTYNDLTITNTALRDAGNLLIGGIIRGAVDGINVQGGGGNTNITNSGEISTTSAAGIYLGVTDSAKTHVVTNSGLISGGNHASFGYGINNDTAGAFTLNNNAGGQISGGLGGLLLSGTGLQTLNLNAGSTTGNIVVNDTGSVVATIAGVLSGYNAAAVSGIDTLTLTATGSITGAVSLGGGNDVFNWQGGTIGGTVDGGAGINYFNVALGAGNSASRAANATTNFFLRDLQSGALTLTGSSASSGQGWSVRNGATLNFNTSAFNVAGNSYAINMYGGTVNVLSGATVSGLNNFAATFDANAVTFNNAGTISVDGNVFLSNGARMDVTNSGTMTAGSYGGVVFSSGGGTLTNTGTITGGSFITANLGTAVTATSAVTINNNGSGIIQTSTGGPYTVRLGSGSTVNNAAGAIIRQVAANRGAAISATGATTVNNSGLISTVSTTEAAIHTGGALTLANSGSITGGVYNVYTNQGVLTNDGTLSGAGTSSIYLFNGGTVLNNAAGVINGAGASGFAIDGINGTNSVTNRGLITGGASGAIRFQAFIGQSLNLTAGSTTTGSVTSMYGSMTGTIAGALNGTYIGDNAGLASGVDNLTIAATGSIDGGATGIQTSRGLTLANFGSLTGTGFAINATGSDAANISLRAGSTTSGAIQLGSGNDTLQLYSGQGTGNGGTLGAAAFGALDLGGGSNTLQLRGDGDGTAANGAAGSITLGAIGGLGVLTKTDTGTWTINGDAAGVTSLNAGLGGGNNGLLILNGTGLTSAININGATVRAMNAAALGTGAITMLNPTLQFASTGTYGNAISLAATSPATDPTNLQTFGTGITATLTGAITEAVAGQPLVFSSVDANGVANAGTFVLTNGLNSWTGTTTINAGTTLRGTTGTISGGSIVNNGVLNYDQTTTGTVNQAISGAGALQITGSGAYVALFGNNTFTGGTTVTNGTLQVGDGGTGGSITGAISVASGARVTFARGDNNNFTSAISGAGSVRLVGTNTLSGAITTQGTISVDSASGGTTTLAGARSGANAAAVTLTGTNTTLTVASTGSLAGGQHAGVRISGTNNTVNNFGLITNVGTGGESQWGAGIAVLSGAGTTTTISNGSGSNATAAISGRNAAINHISGSAGTLVVNNYGSLFGDLYNGIENQGGSGALTVNNFAGATINGQGNAGGGNGISNGSAALLTVVNAGSIYGRTHAISSGSAIALTNSGRLEGINSAAVNAGAGLTLQNTGYIYADLAPALSLASGGTIVNGGSGLTPAQNLASRIESGSSAAIYSANGALDLTNYGRIVAAGNGVQIGTGGAYTGAVSVTNAGLIQGSSADGIILNAAGTITNLSGGVISGVASNGGVGIRLTGNGTHTLNLNAGSTVTGSVEASATSGANTTVLGGALNGSYAGGTGADSFTLASTGSVTGGVSLGSGTDAFTYEGGTFGGSIDGGAGTDSFTSNLGLAGVRTVSLSNVTNFETLAHQSGTLTLTGTGGFANGASVSGGRLNVDGTMNAALGVASGAALGGIGTINGAVTMANGSTLFGAQGSTLTMSSLALGSGSFIDATFTGAGGSALFNVTGNLTLDGTVNVSSVGAFGMGVYGLLTYGGTLTDNGLLIGTMPGGTQRLNVQTSVAGQVNLVHAPTELLFWDGGNAGQHNNNAVNGGAGTWTAAGSNWTDANGLFNGAMTPQPGFAIFQGVGGTVTVDNSAGAVGVTGMQFAADGYTVQGDAVTLAAPSTTVRVGNGTAGSAGWTTTIASALVGAGGLVKTDFGTLILTGENTYSGGTSVEGGSLRIGAGGWAGSFLGAAVLANNANLTFARSDNHAFVNAVSGTGTVTVDGVATLSGAITATGGLSVTAGSTATLSSVTTGLTAVTLGAGATVNVASGGTISSTSGTAILAQGATATVNNAGSVAGAAGTAILSSGSLTLVNSATGSISGLYAVSAAADLNLANAGSISASIANFNNSAIYAGGQGRIANTGSILSATNAIYTQGRGDLTNSGLIRGGGAASTVRFVGANAIVNNTATGEINTTGTGVGVYLDGLNASVTNAGLIRGGNAVWLVGGGTVTNSGTLTGSLGSGVVSAGGDVSNLAGGAINGSSNGVIFNAGIGSVTNAGSIIGTGANGVIFNAGGSLTNTGTISGALQGVRSLAGLTLSSSGTITGTGGTAVESVGVFNDTLTFLAGSTTNGAILSGDGADTISLAGVVNGLVDAGDGADSVSLFDSGSISGLIDGGAGVDAFILDGSATGSLNIGNVANFESRTKTGVGSWTLTGVDSAAVDWAINGGVLAVSGGQAINDGASVGIGAAGTLRLLGDETIAGLNGVGAVDLGSSTTLTIGSGASSYAGVIGGVAGNLTIASGATLGLGGANTFAGTTSVSGALRLDASNALSDLSTLAVAAGGVMDLQAFNDTVLRANLGGTLNGTGTLTAGRYELTGATVNANLGAGDLVQVSGSSTLNGTSASQLVSIAGGTLGLGAADRLSNSATVTVASGATLNLNAFSDTVGLLGLSGTLNGTGTLTAGRHELTGATVNANLGAGDLVQVSGSSTLNGASASQLANVAGGTLSLGAANRLSDTATVVVG